MQVDNCSVIFLLYALEMVLVVVKCEYYSNDGPVRVPCICYGLMSPPFSGKLGPTVFPFVLREIEKTLSNIESLMLTLT